MATIQLAGESSRLEGIAARWTRSAELRNAAAFPPPIAKTRAPVHVNRDSRGRYADDQLGVRVRLDANLYEVVRTTTHKYKLI